MPDTRQYRDSARVRNTEHSPKIKGTPGTQPWKAAVIADLRDGFGVEDIALRLECRPDAVRGFVATLRRMGLLPRIYAEARCDWRSVASDARKARRASA